MNFLNQKAKTKNNGKDCWIVFCIVAVNEMKALVNSSRITLKFFRFMALFIVGLSDFGLIFCNNVLRAVIVVRMSRTSSLEITVFA